MRHLQKNMQDDGGPFVQRLVDAASFLYHHVLPGEKFAVDGEASGLAEMVQPVGDEVHRRGRGTAFTQLALRIIGIHAVEHDELDEIGKDLFPFKQITDPVDQRNGTAVIFRRLADQQILHNGTSSFLSRAGKSENFPVNLYFFLKM